MPPHPEQLVFVGALVAALAFFHWVRRLFWVFSLVVLPGTLAHEGCHLLLGMLLNGKPVRFSLVPKREGRGWVMGSVTCTHLRWYNAFFIGMAPLLLLPLALWLLTWRLGLTPEFRWQEGVAVYLIANLVYAALPSWQDWKIAARSPIGWILLAVGLGWAYLASQKTPRALPPEGKAGSRAETPFRSCGGALQGSGGLR